jgi:LDH2 family malate/lactate/ureidoglycolate dehydrogenase
VSEKILAGGTITVQAAALRKMAAGILKAVGAPEQGAQLVADALVAASLRGTDSHGILLLPAYVRQIEEGDMDPQAQGHVVSESGGCVVYDGENGIGHVISRICCGHAVRLARECGIAMVVARNSNHFGVAAYWAQMISDGGMAGIVMCNASPRVPPWQGKEGRTGTNPLCMSLPVPPPGSWLLDMATTTVAANKIYSAAAKGQREIPPGWAMDSDGVPTTDAETAINGLLMPLGGYKGSGLALMVEILCAVLSGGAMSTDVGGLYIRGRPTRVSQMFLAIDVTRFMPLEEFRARIGSLVQHVKSAAPAKGYTEVMVAGDPEWRAQEIRRREGIPVHADVWEKLAALAARLNVPV